MIRALLRRLGFVHISYGFSCGRHWIEIDGKVIAQTPGNDFWLEDESVRRLAIAVVPRCAWEPQEGDQWFIQSYKKRWPWHDLEAILDARGIRAISVDIRSDVGATSTRSDK